MTLYVRSGGIYQPVDFDELARRDSGVYTKFQELSVRDAGIYKSVWRADAPPPAPTSLSAISSNGGVVTVGWAWPANDEGDYNRVEVQQPGDIARAVTAYPGTSQVRSGYANGTTVSLEARTVDNGGQVSGWVPVPSVGAINALPGPAAIQNFYWDGSYLHINWYDPGNPYNDIYAIQVIYRLASEAPWVVQGPYPAAGGLRQVLMEKRASDALHYAFIRVFNSAGYSDTPVWAAWTPPAPGTEKDLTPTEANSWAYAAGLYRNDGTVRQGQFSATPMGLHFGMFFYGDQIYNASHGFAPVSADIFMMRRGTEGFTGPVFFTGHGYASNPGVAPTGSGPSWTSTGDFAGSDAAAWEPIPAGAVASMMTGETKGIGMFTFSTFQSNYRVFRGPSENMFAGMIRLRW